MLRNHLKKQVFLLKALEKELKGGGRVTTIKDKIISIGGRRTLSEWTKLLGVPRSTVSCVLDEKLREKYQVFVRKRKIHKFPKEEILNTMEKHYDEEGPKTYQDWSDILGYTKTQLRSFVSKNKLSHYVVSTQDYKFLEIVDAVSKDWDGTLLTINEWESFGLYPSNFKRYSERMSKEYGIDIKCIRKIPYKIIDRVDMLFSLGEQKSIKGWAKYFKIHRLTSIQFFDSYPFLKEIYVINRENLKKHILSVVKNTKGKKTIQGWSKLLDMEYALVGTYLIKNGFINKIKGG